MTYPFPAPDLFPGPTLFPADDTISPGYQQPAEIALNGLILTAERPDGTQFILDDIDGWLGGTGSSLSVMQKLRAPGGWPSPRQMTPRQMSISGGIVAPNVAARMRAEADLVAACALNAGLLVVTEGLITRWCIVYRQDAPTITKDTDTSSTWSIQLTAPDPRKFAAAAETIASLPSVSGGLTFPLTFPVTFNAVIKSGQCSANNIGNYVGPVTARIAAGTSPLVGPVLTHVTTGLSLAFDPSFVLNPGEWLDIDMENRTVLANGQTSRNAQIVSRGFSGFEPGDNAWAFSAVSGGADATLTIWGTPAWQ